MVNIPKTVCPNSYVVINYVAHGRVVAWLALMIRTVQCACACNMAVSHAALVGRAAALLLIDVMIRLEVDLLVPVLLVRLSQRGSLSNCTNRLQGWWCHGLVDGCPNWQLPVLGRTCQRASRVLTRAGVTPPGWHNRSYIAQLVTCYVGRFTPLGCDLTGSVRKVTGRSAGLHPAFAFFRLD
jgi:hypothetical protein